MPTIEVETGSVYTFLPSASRTATGNSEAYEGFGAASALRLQLDVTAVTGTGPTLLVTVEDSIDGVEWNQVATFTSATGVSRQVANVTDLFFDMVRVRFVLGGTSPNFTFSVRAQSA